MALQGMGSAVAEKLLCHQRCAVGQHQQDQHIENLFPAWIDMSTSDRAQEAS